MVFDMAVNSGPARAVRTLQACLGVAADGAFGPLTRTALTVAEPRTLIRRFAREREAFFRSLGAFDVFGRGWLRRLAAVTVQAEAWA
jgi:lysozyme family protein